MKHHIVRLALIALGAWVAAVQAEPGVTPTSILIGQSAAFTGPASELGNEMRAGALAYFQMVNAAGGINGRKIEMRSLDDGYEPDRAAANTKKLIEGGVFLLFGYVGTPTSNAAKPIFTAAKVPFVGAFTGAESLRNPLNRYIFNIRASYFDETDKIVGQMTGQTLDRIAVFYQNDDYGKAGLAGVERAMQKRNIKIVATGTVERNTTDVAAAVGGDRQGRTTGSHHDLGVQIRRRVHQGYARRRPQSAVHERVIRRQQGARARGRSSRARRRHLAGRCRSHGSCPIAWSRSISNSSRLRPASRNSPLPASKASSPPRSWSRVCVVQATTSRASDSSRRWSNCAISTSAAIS